MSGFGNPFKDIPKSIWQSLKRKITRKWRCSFCKRVKSLKELERDYLNRFVCIGSNSDSDCAKINAV
jgi:hypothetical protein